MRPRLRGTIHRGPLAALAAIFAFLLAAPAARADYAVLRNGQRLRVTSYQRQGETVRLDLPGGSVTLPADELVSIEREEVFPPNPPSEPDVPYAEQIRNAASQYGLDPKLIASVIAVESNFDARAVSAKSALGLMQLLPKTAAGLSVRNVFDPQQNIAGGARYLRQLLDRYSQNLVFALAAYNAGPQRVERYRGVPPFRETRDYIRRVTAKLRSNASLGASASSLPFAHQ